MSLLASEWKYNFLCLFLGLSRASSRRCHLAKLLCVFDRALNAGLMSFGNKYCWTWIRYAMLFESTGTIRAVLKNCFSKKSSNWVFIVVLWLGESSSVITSWSINLPRRKSKIWVPVFDLYATIDKTLYGSTLFFPEYLKISMVSSSPNCWVQAGKPGQCTCPFV